MLFFEKIIRKDKNNSNRIRNIKYEKATLFRLRKLIIFKKILKKTLEYNMISFVDTWSAWLLSICHEFK